MRWCTLVVTLMTCVGAGHGFLTSPDGVQNGQTVWEGWTAWSCTMTSNVCLGYRNRTCSVPGDHVNCPPNEAYEVLLKPGCCSTGIVIWGSWSERTCTYYGDKCYGYRFRNCSTGNKNDCPGDDSDLDKCPDEACAPPPEWMEWSHWKCGSPNNYVCLMNRNRECSSNVTIDCTTISKDKHYEIIPCDPYICPVHWLDWTIWQCAMVDHGMCLMTKTRVCSTGDDNDCLDLNLGPKSQVKMCERSVCPALVDITESKVCSNYISHDGCHDSLGCHHDDSTDAFLCSQLFGASLCPKLCGCCNSTYNEQPQWSSWNYTCSLEYPGRCRARGSRYCTLSTGPTTGCVGQTTIEENCTQSNCPEYYMVNQSNCNNYVPDHQTDQCTENTGCDLYKQAHTLGLICRDTGELCPKSCGCCNDNTYNEQPHWSAWNYTCLLEYPGRCRARGSRYCTLSTGPTTGCVGQTTTIEENCTQSNCPEFYMVRQSDCSHYVAQSSTCSDKSGCVVYRLTNALALICQDSGEICPKSCGCCEDSTQSSNTTTVSVQTTTVSTTINTNQPTTTATAATSPIFSVTTTGLPTGASTTTTSSVFGSTTDASTSTASSGFGSTIDAISTATSGLQTSTDGSSTPVTTVKFTTTASLTTLSPSTTAMSSTQSPTSVSSSTSISSTETVTTSPYIPTSATPNTETTTTIEQPHWSEWNYSCALEPPVGICRARGTRVCALSTGPATGCVGPTTIVENCTQSNCPDLYMYKSDCSQFNASVDPCADLDECVRYKLANILPVICQTMGDRCPLSCGCCLTTTLTTPVTTTTTTTQASTTTPPTTTMSTTTLAISPVYQPYTIPPIPTQCAVCSGPPQLCEKLYATQTCQPPHNYCVNEVTNSANGERQIKRRCGEVNECYQDWYLGSSDQDYCLSYDQTKHYFRSFNCTFCCTQDNCNVPIRPELHSLYADLHV